MKLIIDTEKRILEADSNKIDFDVLKALGKDGYPEGTYFKILKRADDGAVIIQRFYPSETSE